MSKKDLKEWEDSGYVVNNPENYNESKRAKDCFEYAVDQMQKDIPGWKVNKAQASLIKKSSKGYADSQLALLDQADKRAGVSRLTSYIAKNKDASIVKEELEKVISILMLGQDEKFLKDFQFNLRGHSQDSSHLHAFDMPALLKGKQNYDPQFAFKNIKKMEEVFARYETLILEIRTRLDFKNPETEAKLDKLLDILSLKNNGISCKDNYKTV